MHLAHHSFLSQIEASLPIRDTLPVAGYYFCCPYDRFRIGEEKARQGPVSFAFNERTPNLPLSIIPVL